MRRRFQLSAREAHRLTDLAEVLPRWMGVAGALAAGRVAVEAATVITEVLRDLPGTTSGADATRAEALLLEQAATLDPGELARCGQALREARPRPRRIMGMSLRVLKVMGCWEAPDRAALAAVV